MNVTIDPPPPFHSTVTLTSPKATDAQFFRIAAVDGVPHVGVKDAFDQMDFTLLGQARLPATATLCAPFGNCRGSRVRLF